jgi:pimeloyl-ACP methyl ester carboxylesterase
MGAEVLPDEVSWRKRCADDPELTALGRAAQVTFAISSGAQAVAIGFADGRPGEPGGPAEFTLRADVEDWTAFLQAAPPSPYHSFFGMLMRVPTAEVEGDELTFVQHAHLVRRVLEIAREMQSGWSRPVAASSTGDEDAYPDEIDHIVGRYLTLRPADGAVRVFYEESGAGRDIVFLHTAGADGRQYHHLMNDARLRERCRMITLDLPWHGRSSPSGHCLPGEYELSTDMYCEAVTGLVEALDLRSPIVVGSSMGGEICLELAHRHPERLGGVVACEASERVTGRQVQWARHPKVNQALFVPEWVDGLMAPQSPQEYRREVWWGYSQGGFGTFFGDICFYSGEWDGRDRVPLIDTARCPVIMLTGEYDYSCTPQMSAETADRIPGAVFREMRGLGHFPMSENPPVFAEHLLTALAEIGEAT